MRILFARGRPRNFLRLGRAGDVRPLVGRGPGRALRTQGNPGVWNSSAGLDICQATNGPDTCRSSSPSRLLADDQFGLYAVAARFPHNLAGQIPWQRVQEGV
jgi:hypothetical protein